MAQEGKWITVNGNHVLIKDGETVEQAMKRQFSEGGVRDTSNKKQKQKFDTLPANRDDYYEYDLEQLSDEEYDKLRSDIADGKVSAIKNLTKEDNGKTYTLAIDLNYYDDETDEDITIPAGTQVKVVDASDINSPVLQFGNEEPTPLGIDTLYVENEGYEDDNYEDDNYESDLENTRENIIAKSKKIKDAFDMPKEDGWKESTFGEKSFLKNEGTNNEMFIQYNGSNYDGSNQEYVAGYMENGEYVTKKFNNLEDAKSFVNNVQSQKQKFDTLPANRDDYYEYDLEQLSDEEYDKLRSDIADGKVSAIKNLTKEDNGKTYTLAIDLNYYDDETDEDITIPAGTQVKVVDASDINSPVLQFGNEEPTPLGIDTLYVENNKQEISENKREEYPRSLQKAGIGKIKQLLDKDEIDFDELESYIKALKSTYK